ncbi:MAG: ubiquinone biosynthesis protein [Verrucomicrobiales bacterium]|jgi:ubiquinone biosynthesis protein
MSNDTHAVTEPSTISTFASANPEFMLEGFDWEKDRGAIGFLINQMLPLESLVPDIYSEWRLVVRDALGYLGSHLSPDRLRPKLVEQMQLPSDLPLEKRLMILIQQMPSMQKIGQTVARNRNLNASFRVELSRLENTIDDVSSDDIRKIIESELGDLVDSYSIEVESEILAEASVSAVIGFTWVRPESRQREKGVFKVLKPHVRNHLSEELGILSELAEYFDAHRDRYGLSEVNLSDVFNDVRRLLEMEVDFSNEQATLVTAARRYPQASGIRVPKLIEVFSTPLVTAMSAEHGIKVTEAFRSVADRFKRRQMATRLIEALVAIPLLSPDEESVFHADPHAGNLFVDEEKQELLLFDWALTAKLSRLERRRILLFLTAVTLRDRRLITRAAASLCENDLAQDAGRTRILRDQVRAFLEKLPQLRVAGVTDALSLLDQLIRAGLTFSTTLVVFRKMLFTLDGVLNDVVPGMRMDPTLIWYLTEQRTKSSALFQCFFDAPTGEFEFPLSRFDEMKVAWSAQFYCLRAFLQAQRRVRGFGKRKS